MELRHRSELNSLYEKAIIMGQLVRSRIFLSRNTCFGGKIYPLRGQMELHSSGRPEDGHRSWSFFISRSYEFW